MRPFNSGTPYATDYRGLLVAKITAKFEPTSGRLARRRVYEWVEQSLSAVGGEETPPQPRRGVYESPDRFDNVLLDANDADLALGSHVWARMKGAVGGATVYETVTPLIAVSESGSGSGSDAGSGAGTTVGYFCIGPVLTDYACVDGVPHFERKSILVTATVSGGRISFTAAFQDAACG